MEVMRDKGRQLRHQSAPSKTSIPWAFTPGDSITVGAHPDADRQEFQIMRDQSFAVIRAVGVRRGSNIQSASAREWPHGHHRDEPARQPQLRARVKATGFSHREDRRQARRRLPARRTQERHTRETPASFEPSIDYVVTKFRALPSRNSRKPTPAHHADEKASAKRWPSAARSRESLQKCLRSLEIGRKRPGRRRQTWASDGSLWRYNQTWAITSI